METAQRAFRHRLGPISNGLQGREIIAAMSVAQQHEVDEGGRGWQQLHFVLLNRSQYRIGIPILDGDDTTAVGELVEHGVEPSDVIVEQEGDGTARVPANLE